MGSQTKNCISLTNVSCFNIHESLFIKSNLISLNLMMIVDDLPIASSSHREAKTYPKHSFNLRPGSSKDHILYNVKGPVIVLTPLNM